MILASNLIKRFNGNAAVNDVSINIEKGKIFGLLGPNAAGKTTVIRMLCGIINSDEGEIAINNMRVERAKTDFGYVAQHFGQYEELSVWEKLKFYASMYNVTDKARLNYLLDFYFILAAGWFLFDLPHPSSQLNLFFLALIFVAVMISLGLLISLIAKTQQQAMFLAFFIIVPSILLSGFVFPIEAIPEIVRPISYLIPFTYFVEIIRGLLIKYTLFVDLLPSFIKLAGFAIFFVAVSIMKFRKTL